jgi:SAM-dependent methyltransferase
MFGRNNEAARKKWLQNKLMAIPNGMRILDAGAGELANKIFCGHLTYVAQDFCKYDGGGNGFGLQTNEWDVAGIDIISDITAIPEPDESFDVILCSEVLEHVTQPSIAVYELARLCKPGGFLIITAPFCSLTHFAPFHYVTGFSKYWYEFNLNKLDFEIIELLPNGGWMDYVAQEIWRLPYVGVNYSSKFLGWLALFAAAPLFIILKMMKARDKGSSELLTFGYHVLARKRG